MKKLVLRLTIILVSIIIAFASIEAVLVVSGVNPIYQVNFEPPNYGSLICDDEIGCRFNYDVVTADCTTPFHQTIRNCLINQDGHFDSDNFQTRSGLETHRILMLGDSFTFGYTADVGRSWVEVVEQSLLDLDVTIWNAGVPGSGTKNAILKLKHFGPKLNPQIAVLGFHLTDYYDNLLPIDQWFVLDTGESGGVWVKQYRLTDSLEVEKVSPTALYFRMQGVDVIDLSEWQRVLLSTRIGTVALPRLMGLQVQTEPTNFLSRPDEWYAPALEATAQYIEELKNIADQSGIKLLVLIIPDYTSMKWTTTTLDDIAYILEETGISYITVEDLLTLDDYVNENPNDTHWNNSGHSKAGQRVGACLRDMLMNDYKWCEDAVTPSDWLDQ